MRKSLFLIALMVAGYASAAPIVIYDTLTGTGGWTTTGGQPRNRMADGFNAIAKASNITWSVTQVEFIMYVGGATTINRPTVEMKLWNKWVPDGISGAGSAVFDDLAGSRTFYWDTITTTGVTAYWMVMTLTTPILLKNSENIGIEFNITDNGVVNSYLGTGMRDLAPYIAGANPPAANVFYRDGNSNGFIDTADARILASWTYNNIGVRITAEAVPEPATVGAVATGLLALLARRRRK